MSGELVFVTHSTSTDNEAGIASGHRDVGLSELGRAQAAELGQRYRAAFYDVYCSDLRRAVETAEIAFGTAFQVDARLREQDFGERTGAPSRDIEVERLATVGTPFPGGEGLRDCAERVQSFLGDVRGERVLLIGHRGIKVVLDHLLGGMTLDDAVRAPYVWQPGWTYELGARALPL